MLRTSSRRLATFIALYGGGILLASLYPLSGWITLTSPVFDFLVAPWPRYITRTDLATNLFIYTPLGYACAIGLASTSLRSHAVISGVLAAAALSLGCETLQQFLPRRNASNLDLLVNSLGALIGALLAIHHHRWLRAMRAMQRWRGRWFKEGALTSSGLGLLLAWLLAQFALVPISGLGWLHLYLRPIDVSLNNLAGLNSSWFWAVFLEMVAVGAFSACLLRPGRYVAGLVLLVFAGFFMKLLSAAILLKLSVLGGVLSLETLAAFFLAFWLLLLPGISRHRHSVAGISISLVLLTRLAQGQGVLPDIPLLNIVGLAKHLGALWPLPALAVLAWQFIQRRQRLKSSIAPT